MTTLRANQPLAEAILPLMRTPLVSRGVRYSAYAGVATLAAALLLVAAATVPVLFGYHTYIVDGRSMEPTLSKGSVAVTHPTSPRALRESDIVAFKSSPESKPVLHRIVSVTEVDGQRRFFTQGDANAKPDATGVTLAGDGDRVVYSVPYAGYILEVAGSLLGRLALIGLPLCYFTAAYLWKLRRVAKPAPAGPFHRVAPVGPLAREPLDLTAWLPVAAPAPVAEALAAAALPREPFEFASAMPLERIGQAELDAAEPLEAIEQAEGDLAEPKEPFELRAPRDELPPFLLRQLQSARVRVDAAPAAGPVVEAAPVGATRDGPEEHIAA